jgi:hypothetical protein
MCIYFFRFLKIFCKFYYFWFNFSNTWDCQQTEVKINTVDSIQKRILLYLRSRKERGLIQLGLTFPWLYCAKSRLSSDQEYIRLNRPLGLIHHFTCLLTWNAQRISLLICSVIWTNHQYYTVRPNVSHWTSVEMFPGITLNKRGNVSWNEL